MTGGAHPGIFYRLSGEPVPQLSTPRSLSLTARHEIDDYLLDAGWFEELEDYKKGGGTWDLPPDAIMTQKTSILEIFLQQHGWSDDLRPSGLLRTPKLGSSSHHHIPRSPSSDVERPPLSLDMLTERPPAALVPMSVSQPTLPSRRMFGPCKAPAAPGSSRREQDSLHARIKGAAPEPPTLKRNDDALEQPSDQQHIGFQTGRAATPEPYGSHAQGDSAAEKLRCSSSHGRVSTVQQRRSCDPAPQQIHRIAHNSSTCGRSASGSNSPPDARSGGGSNRRESNKRIHSKWQPKHPSSGHGGEEIRPAPRRSAAIMPARGGAPMGCGGSTGCAIARLSRTSVGGKQVSTTAPHKISLNHCIPPHPTMPTAGAYRLQQPHCSRAVF